MIDLSRIRSIKTLESMKRDCEFFIQEPVVKELCLTEHGMDAEEFEDDKNDASELIMRIDLRIKSLKSLQDTKSNSPRTKKFKGEKRKQTIPTSSPEDQAGQ